MLGLLSTVFLYRCHSPFSCCCKTGSNCVALTDRLVPIQQSYQCFLFLVSNFSPGLLHKTSDKWVYHYPDFWHTMLLMTKRPAGLKHRSHSTGHCFTLESNPKPSIWLTLDLKINLRPRVSQIEGFAYFPKRKTMTCNE